MTMMDRINVGRDAVKKSPLILVQKSSVNNQNFAVTYHGIGTSCRTGPKGWIVQRVSLYWI